MKITVRMNGNDYEVTLAEPPSTDEPRVFVMVRRSCVNPRGFYQADIIYRTIKPNSQNWNRAVRLAKESINV